MDLNTIRKNINEIDDEMKRLFDARLVCSEQVASVKMAEHDEVFKPQREREIAERFSGEEDIWYLPYIKKVIQISRKYQYKAFVDVGQVDEAFYIWIDSVDAGNTLALSQGGKLTLVVRTDPMEEHGLAVGSALSVISDTGLKIMKLAYDDSKNEINIALWIENTEQQRQEAYMLAYMLYKESVTGNIAGQNK